MAGIQSFLPIAALAAVLSMELVAIPSGSTKGQIRSQPTQLGQTLPDTWQVSQTFQPPNRGAPPSSVGGASRGPCFKGKITALMPANNLSLTISERPTLFWHIPESTAKTAQFELLDKNQNPVYQTTLQLPNKAGIVSLKLPATSPPLQLDQMYYWSLTVVCNSSEDPGDRSGNAIVDGWIERIQANPTLANQLAKSTPRDRAALYADAGIWQDSLTTLAELRRPNPNEPAIAASWEKLLKSVGLDSNVMAAPLIDCCTTDN